ncbi:MAG: FG-GAP-like repeat-containing protein, partial [Myxococcota bacterium]
AAGLGASPSASLSASSSGTYFGRALAGGADVNHDGYDDIVIGAPRTSSRAGAVYVHHGSASGVATSPARTLTPPSGQFYFGARVTLGDFDRDGHADLAVNAPYHGMLYVYEGSAAGVGAGITTAMSAELGLMSSTAAQPAVGDWNGDGTDDLVWVDGLEVRVHHGSAAGLSSSATATLSVSYAFGSDEVLAAAGDADGDGYDDLLVFDGEEIDWHRGGAAGLSDDASATLADPGTAPTGESDTRFGYARAAGDVDGDGFSDVVIGASQADAAYVFAGARAGLSTTSSLTLGGEGLSTFGEVVTGAGDVNGDGFADVAVGDPEAEAVYVFHGSAAGVGTTAATTLGDGAASGTFGAAVA